MSKESIKELHRGEFLVLLREGHWEYVRRTSNRGAVFVCATTPDDEIVLVEQYRVPLHARSIELPAGIRGDEPQHADETPEACALRELEEETGYRGAEAKVLAVGPVAPGMTSELLYMVGVTGLEKVAPGGGVGHEAITVHKVRLSGVRQWLEERSAAGLHVELRIYTALYLAEEATRDV